MSEQDPRAGDGDGPGPESAYEQDGAPMDPPATDPKPASRAASLTLASDGPGAGQGPALDPANESLADALRITFRLVQFAMVVLVALFLLSGFQTVQESERGIATRFGEVTSPREGLEPGFQFAWPYPIGELVKVDVANDYLEVDQAFWPDPVQTTRATDQSAAESLRQRQSLDPVESGSNITADLNVAHTQWLVRYRKVDVTSFAERVLPREERDLVSAAVERGVVHALAETTIDELLQPDDPRDLLRRVRAGAQVVLSAAGSGIEIESIELSEKAPPAFVRRNFEAVFSARSDAQAAQTQAESERSNLLSRVAGGAAARELVGASAYLAGGEGRLGLIDRYETALAVGDSQRAAELLGAIDAVLLGETVTVDGREIRVRATGEVAQLLANAESDRRTIASREEANLNTFRAKREQFRANPSVMLTSDWARAWGDFYESDTVQMFRVPPGERLEIRLNEDPEIARRAERRQLELENERALEERERAFREGRYELEEGISRPEE